jgi:hypothetical protein
MLAEACISAADPERATGLIAGLLLAAAVGWGMGRTRGYRAAYREMDRVPTPPDEDFEGRNYPFC